MNIEDLQQYIESNPFFNFLNLRVLSKTKEEILTSMNFEQQFVGNPIMRNFHGGIIASYLEASASLLILNKMENNTLKPINLSIDYIRPAGPRPMKGYAKLIRSGRRMSTIEATAWQMDAEKPVAKSVLHFLMV